MTLLNKLKTIGGDLLKKKIKTTSIEKGTGLDLIKQQIIEDAAHLALKGKEPISRRNLLGLIGKRATRTPAKIAGDYVNDVSDNFSYMGCIVNFQNLTRRDFLIAGGITGTGTLAGAGIGFTHNKLLHKKENNRELSHDIISHGVGDGILPASAYLLTKKMTIL